MNSQQEKNKWSIYIGDADHAHKITSDCKLANTTKMEGQCVKAAAQEKLVETSSVKSL